MQVRADVATLIKLVTEEHAAKKAAKPRRPSPEQGREKNGAEARARSESRSPARRKHEGRQHKRRHQSPGSAPGGVEHEIPVVEIARA